MIDTKDYTAQMESPVQPHQGHASGTERISLFQFISDLPHAIFHVDRGILFNFRELFKHPAESIHSYLAGNRKAFFNPATYLVMALLFNYLVVKITDLHFYDVKELATMTPLAAQAIMDYDALQWWFLEHTYIYILIAIPASSLFLHLIFRMSGKGLNFAESAVVVLFTIGQGVLIQSLIYLSFGWVEDGSFRRTMEAFNMAILILYASYVVYQLIPTVRLKIVRSVVSLFAGTGLAAVWIASAYLLYYVMK